MFLRLIETWATLGKTERVVLVEIAARIAIGQRTYGELDLERDTRDFLKETGEELFDGVVYLACNTVRERMKNGIKVKAKAERAGSMKEIKELNW